MEKQEALPKPLVLEMPSVTQENQMNCTPRCSDFYATELSLSSRAGRTSHAHYHYPKGVPTPVYYNMEFVGTVIYQVVLLR